MYRNRDLAGSWKAGRRTFTRLHIRSGFTKKMNWRRTRENWIGTPALRSPRRGSRQNRRPSTRWKSPSGTITEKTLPWKAVLRPGGLASPSYPGGRSRNRSRPRTAWREKRWTAIPYPSMHLRIRKGILRNFARPSMSGFRLR